MRLYQPFKSKYRYNLLNMSTNHDMRVISVFGRYRHAAVGNPYKRKYLLVSKLQRLSQWGVTVSVVGLSDQTVVTA